MKKEEEISTILGSLERVEAPGNFEGMVRTRIAEKRPTGSTTRPAFLLALKFALPLILLVVLGAVIILSDETSIDQAVVPPVDNSYVKVAEIDQPSGSDDRIATSTNSLRPAPPANRNTNVVRVEDPPMSEDQALSQDNSTVFPNGVDPRNAIVSNRRPPETGTITPTSVLAMVGITSSCSRNGCLATDVRSGSIAERSGVAAGDLIEAIDNRLIGSTTQLTGTVSVSSLRILRHGRRLTIRLSTR